MASMDYCKFENTYRDFIKCTIHLESIWCDDKEIWESEWYYAQQMKEWCERYIYLMNKIEEDTEVRTK